MTGMIIIRCKFCETTIEGEYTSSVGLEDTIVELDDLANNEARKRDWVGSTTTPSKSPLSDNFLCYGVCSEKCHQKDVVRVSWTK